MGIKFRNFKLKNLTPGQQRLWNTLHFLLRLLILSIPLYIMLSIPGVLFPLQGLVTNNAVSLLSLAYPVSNQNILIEIQSPGTEFQFLISEDCTGWKSMLFLFALVFAVPGVILRKRLLGLLAGIPLIYLGNLLRIFLIVWVQQSWGTPAAEFFHVWLWSLGLITLVILIWIIWLRWIKKNALGFAHALKFSLS